MDMDRHRFGMTIFFLDGHVFTVMHFAKTPRLALSPVDQRKMRILAYRDLMSSCFNNYFTGFLFFVVGLDGNLADAAVDFLALVMVNVDDDAVKFVNAVDRVLFHALGGKRGGTADPYDSNG